MSACPQCDTEQSTTSTSRCIVDKHWIIHDTIHITAVCSNSNCKPSTSTTWSTSGEKLSWWIKYIRRGVSIIIKAALSNNNRDLYSILSYEWNRETSSWWLKAPKSCIVFMRNVVIKSAILDNHLQWVWDANSSKLIMSKMYSDITVNE